MNCHKTKSVVCCFITCAACCHWYDKLMWCKISAFLLCVIKSCNEVSSNKLSIWRRKLYCCHGRGLFSSSTNSAFGRTNLRWKPKSGDHGAIVNHQEGFKFLLHTYLILVTLNCTIFSCPLALVGLFRWNVREASKTNDLVELAIGLCFCIFNFAVQRSGT